MRIVSVWGSACLTDRKCTEGLDRRAGWVGSRWLEIEQIMVVADLKPLRRRLWV